MRKFVLLSLVIGALLNNASASDFREPSSSEWKEFKRWYLDSNDNYMFCENKGSGQFVFAKPFISGVFYTEDDHYLSTNDNKVYKISECQAVKVPVIQR